MKKARTSSPDRRDGQGRAEIDKTPVGQSTWSHMIGLVPALETSPEWQEAIDSPYFKKLLEGPDDVQRVQGLIATRIVRKLRDANIRQRIEAGDPFWLDLALRVVCIEHKWLQSGRIQASALGSLARRLSAPEVPDAERRRLSATINAALLNKIDTGAGQEFRALAGIARRVATSDLIAGLEERVRNSDKKSIRINAERMLDYIKGKPYRRYLDSAL